MAGSWLMTDIGVRWDAGVAGMGGTPAHTELNGYLGWVVPGGNGIYEVSGYAISSLAQEPSTPGHGAYLTTPYNDFDVYNSLWSLTTGYYIECRVTPPSAWTSTAYAGVALYNIGGSYGQVDGSVGNGIWQIRTGTTVVLSGSGISAPANGTFDGSGTPDLCFGWRPTVGSGAGRFGFGTNAAGGSRENIMAEDAVPYTQLAPGPTYPGIIQNNAPIGTIWGGGGAAFTVYRDYAVTFRNLQSGWGVKAEDTIYGTGTHFITADSEGECRLTAPLGINPPFSACFITLYSDAGTWSAVVPGGERIDIRAIAIAPALAPLDVATSMPGCVIDWEDSGLDRVGILVNWENDDDWLAHDADDVTNVVTDIDLSIVAANPRIEVDTLTIVLKDLFGDYVPANINSLLYPNVRLARQLRWNLTIDGITECRFHGAITEYTPLLGDQSSTSEQQCRIRAESPLRALASVQTPLTSVPSGVLVNPDGVTGVIPTLLGLVASIIPSSTWALDPTPDSIDAGFLTVGMTIQTALEQCAIFADAIYCIRPHYRTALGQPKFYFVWKARGITHAAFADHVWTETGGDVGGFTPRYTGDVI